MELLQCWRHSPEPWPTIHLIAPQMFMLGNILGRFVQSVVHDIPFWFLNITFTSWGREFIESQWTWPWTLCACEEWGLKLKCEQHLLLSLSNMLVQGSDLIRPQRNTLCVQSLVSFPWFYSSVNMKLYVITAVKLICQHDMRVTNLSLLH